jgi:signal transduction histidine kinase
LAPRHLAAAATAFPSPSIVLAPDAHPAVVCADPVRIAQACANLIANAAEHGGEKVTVHVRASEELVRIVVADDGPGLPAGLAAMTRKARGRRGRRGHGLAVAEAIAADHGGRLFAPPSRTGAQLVLELPAVGGCVRNVSFKAPFRTRPRERVHA